MNSVLKWIVDKVYVYGQHGAGLPSWHNTYESPVPEILKKNEQK